MDLLQQYGSPPSSEPSSPIQQAPKKVPTGTIEKVQLSPTAFDRAQRAHIGPQACKPSTKLPPNPAKTPAKRPRPVSPKPGTTSKKPASAKNPNPPPKLPTTTAHAAAVSDYQNRPWHLPSPSSRTFAELESYTPFIPKRMVHAMPAAHNSGVSALRFAPHHGHLLLSVGMDGAARMWRTSDFALARVYDGHVGAVRDASFDKEGGKFLTAGFDRTVKLWDVETGRVAGNFKMEGVPYCVRFFPGDGGGRQFLAGCGDRTILQIDVRDATNVVQRYDQHMGAVNSISFVEDDRRFVSSADDKVLRVWEYGIPVVIKYVSDPSMHSMPVTVLHPNRKWLACQGMDNIVHVVSARDKFRHHTKKSFKDHIVAGYGCGLTFSPDGRFLGSGDSLGRLFFWDWKSTRTFRTVQAHKGVCIALEWHPTNPSMVASCSWDGDIKIWD